MSESTPTPTDPREAVTADFCAQTNQELSREDLHKLMEQLQSTASKLAAEIAELKKCAPINTHVRLFDLVRYQRSELLHAGLITEEEYGWLCYGSDMANSPKGGSPSRQRLEDYDTLRAELEAARKEVVRELDAVIEGITGAVRVHEEGGAENIYASLAVSVSQLLKERDTALAAKDAAEKALGLEKRRVVGMQRTGEEMQAELDAAVAGLRDIDRAIAGFFWTSDDGKTLRDAEPEESGAPQWFIETWKGLRILIAALTPAPTQEPHAGVTDTTANYMPKVGGKSFRCACGCNVFHKPNPSDATLYQCNSCNEQYRGE